MAFKFEIDESFARAIPRVLSERMERVVECLSEKPHPGAESIHTARKDLKSLRALLRLARGSMPDDETRRGGNILFRDLGRTLSPLRDSQALVEALQTFAKGKFRARSKNSETRNQHGSDFIRAVRSKIEREAVEQLPQDTLKRLRDELHEAMRRAPGWFQKSDSQPLGEWETFVGRGLRGTYRRGKSIVIQLGTLGRENAGDETWHELRKCAKALGYQLRLLRFVWPDLLGTLCETIDRLTEKLGDDHDLVVLRNRILQEPYNSSATQIAAEIRLKFIEALDRRRRKLQSEAYEAACRVYAEKPRQFEGRVRSYWEITRAKSGRGASSALGGHALPQLRKAKDPVSDREKILVLSNPRNRAESVSR